jgi:hypothetical protein
MIRPTHAVQAATGTRSALGTGTGRQLLSFSRIHVRCSKRPDIRTQMLPRIPRQQLPFARSIFNNSWAAKSKHSAVEDVCATSGSSTRKRSFGMVAVICLISYQLYYEIPDMFIKPVWAERLANKTSTSR